MIKKNFTRVFYLFICLFTWCASMFICLFTWCASMVWMKEKSRDLIGPIAASRHRFVISAPEYPSALALISSISSSLNMLNYICSRISLRLCSYILNTLVTEYILNISIPEYPSALALISSISSSLNILNYILPRISLRLGAYILNTLVTEYILNISIPEYPSALALIFSIPSSLNILNYIRPRISLRLSDCNLNISSSLYIHISIYSPQNIHPLGRSYLFKINRKVWTEGGGGGRQKIKQNYGEVNKLNK